MVRIEIKLPDETFVQQHHLNIVRNLNAFVSHLSADLFKHNPKELMQNCRINKKYNSDARVTEMTLEYELSHALRNTLIKFHLQNDVLTYERSDS